MTNPSRNPTSRHATAASEFGGKNKHLKLILINGSQRMAGESHHLGIDRIMVDLERLGKVARQSGRDTHLSAHTMVDVNRVAEAIDPRTELMVRIDPWGPHSPAQIESVLAVGPTAIMLPMYRTASEAGAFIEHIDGRCRTNLLVETVAAVDAIEETVALRGLDELHIGLNDLHIDAGKSFMFQHFADGTVDRVIRASQTVGVACGVGGIARMGEGTLRAELILAEHVRLGSQAVILSRTFIRGLDADGSGWSDEGAATIRDEIHNLRRTEAALHARDADGIAADTTEFRAVVSAISE